MLRYSLVLLIGLSGTAPVRAATWADTLFDEFNKDFGSTPRGTTLVHHFRVVNKTRNTVNISSVRVSCGCVTASALKHSLEPGEETAVLARMDTSRFTGPRTVTIFVQFDRPGSEEVRLWVRANSRQDFGVTPDTLAFGSVRRGAAPRARATISFNGNGVARILQVRAESNYVQPVLKEVRRAEHEVVYELTATLRKDTPVGKWYTDIWLRTNVADLPQLRVPVTVEVQSPLSVMPETVALGRLVLKGEAERRIIVRGARPFRITRVLGGDKELTVRASPTASREIHILTLKYRAERVGEVNRVIKLRTDLPGDEGEIDFRVSATVTAPKAAPLPALPTPRGS